MLKIYLAKGAERRIRSGHLWIFSNEVERIEGSDGEADIPGAAAMLHDCRGKYLGTGYYNRHSLIAARLLSRRREPDEKELLRRRVLAALELRSRLVTDGSEGCRLVYSEGDFLPGLVVDSYGDYLVVQLLTAGMERRKETILSILEEYLRPRGMVLRNDSRFRELEGLDRYVETVGADPPSPLLLDLEGLRMAVDLRAGQKTGHFYDQALNRKLFGKMAGGYDVLDAFCYTGAWGLQAAKAGARSVTFVDSSGTALGLAERNLSLNAFDTCTDFVRSDVSEFLKSRARSGKRYDAVVLDPPAFAKTRKSRRKALEGYLKLNREGIRCLARGGLLVTSTCSYHVDRDEFTAVVAKAAAQCGRFARVLYSLGQAPDHPVPPGLSEAAYLKCLFVQVD